MLCNFLLDSSTSWQLYFQDAATPVMEGIINLHHDLMFFITFIFFFVLVVMARTLYYFQRTPESVNSKSRFVVHGTVIEIVWCIPFNFDYSCSSFCSSLFDWRNCWSCINLKRIGNQWFWSYEYRILRLNLVLFVLTVMLLQKMSLSLVRLDYWKLIIELCYH